MAKNRGNEERAPVLELPADPQRDVHEVVRGEELPAQWQATGISLRTQQEMLAGRNAVMRGAVADADGRMPQLWQWADQGEAFLYEKFKGSGLQFLTSVDDKHIVLTVYRVNELTNRLIELFKLRERAEYFVSELTVTKIIMVL
jgi:hypothetical protein